MSACSFLKKLFVVGFLRKAFLFLLAIRLSLINSCENHGFMGRFEDLFCFSGVENSFILLVMMVWRDSNIVSVLFWLILLYQLSHGYFLSDSFRSGMSIISCIFGSCLGFFVFFFFLFIQVRIGRWSAILKFSVNDEAFVFNCVITWSTSVEDVFVVLVGPGTS